MAVLFQIDHRGVAHISLNRPEVHNALNEGLIAALTEAVEKAANDTHVRILAISGEGKSLCAGADLEDMKASGAKSKAENEADARALGHLFETVNACPKPVLMKAHGAVMGGGVGLVACADIVVADSATQFCLSEVKLGLIPAVISPFVVAKIGVSQARRLFLSAEKFGADEAHHIGLIHHIADDVTAAFDAQISGLLLGAPEAQGAAKTLVRDVAHKPIDFHLMTLTAARIAERRASDEGKEGLNAFLQKRKPRWQS